MESMENETAIHIKNTRGEQRQFVAMMGFACGFLGLFMTLGAIQGEWRGVSGVAGILAVMGFGYWLCLRQTREDVTILGRDGVKLPGNKIHPEFQWSEVEKIEWPKARHREGSIQVRIVLSRKSDRLAPGISLDPASVSPADRLTVIRYLRLAGASLPQENWPEFCAWYAVPTMEECQRSEARRAPNEVVPASKSWARVVLQRFFRLGERSPFLLGLSFALALPVVAPLVLSAVLSRRIWWLISVLFGISAAINLPLLVGWNQHVVALLIVIPLVPLILSLFAPPGEELSRRPANHVPGGVALLTIGVVGGPLLLVVGAHGWIPFTLARLIVCGSAGLLTPLLLIFLIYRQKRIRNEDKEERVSNALQRWAAYESTGLLPDAPACE